MAVVVASSLKYSLLGRSKASSSKGQSAKGRPRLAFDLATRKAKRPGGVLGATKVITYKDYESIVTLKLGGRSHEEIAKAFGLDLNKVRGHIERAMSEYRKGHVKPKSGAVASEGAQKGKDKSVEFVKAITKPVDTIKFKSAPKGEQPVGGQPVVDPYLAAGQVGGEPIEINVGSSYGSSEPVGINLTPIDPVALNTAFQGGFVAAPAPIVQPTITVEA